MIRSQKELALTVTFDEKNAQTEANNQIQQNGGQQSQQPSQQQPGQGGSYYYQWPFNDMFPW